MPDEPSDDRRPYPSTRPREEPDRAVVTPDLDTVFDVLSCCERRLLCEYVADQNKEVFALDALVDVLARELNREPERLRIDLHHRHLPKLERAGLVEYDGRSNVVRYRGQPSIEKWAEHARYVTEQK